MTTEHRFGKHLDEIADASHRYLEAARLVQLEPYLTPINLDEARATFLTAWNSHQPAEPSFSYRDPPEGIENELDRLLEGETYTDPISRGIMDELRLTRSMITAVRHRDGDLMTSTTVAAFGHPSSDLIAHARQILETTRRDVRAEATSLSDAEAANGLRSALHRAGLDQWRVVVDAAMSARMSVRSVDRVVRVRTGSSFTRDELARLVVHELGTHVARSENGRRQPVGILAVGLPGYLSTEEGLAAHHEQQRSLADPSTTRRYALRVLAAARATQGSFCDVFAEMVQETDANDAFAIAQRAKRGLADTAKPAAYVKDHVYLRGLLDVRSHLALVPDDHQILMCGKVGLEHLDFLHTLDEQGLLVEPAFGPDAF
jgi:uncharacterized protein (TIGR02421 family)